MKHWRSLEKLIMKVNYSRVISFFKAVLAAGLIILMIPPESIAQDNSDTHTVRQGDTLFSISRQYDVSVAELREWNDLGVDDLSVGMEIRVTPPREQGAVTHTVGSQETLFSISRQYNVTTAEIQQWNDLQTTVLSVGQELVIYTDADTGDDSEQLPEPETEEEQIQQIDRESIVGPTSAASTYYTVRSGDYLNLIASQHGMTTDELRQLNNLDDDMIRVGQQLIVRESQSTPVVDEDYEESTPQGRFVNYMVESGENMGSVLERFSMTEVELRSLNPGVDLASLGSGQRLTVLLPPNRAFENPYRKSAGLRNLGQVNIRVYNDNSAGSTTTSGELYSPSQLTAAHENITLGSIIYVENPQNGRGVYVKINDRTSNDGLMLSHRAFEALRFVTPDLATANIYQEVGR